MKVELGGKAEHEGGVGTERFKNVIQDPGFCQ